MEKNDRSNNDVKLYAELNKRCSKFIPKVDEVIDYAINSLPKINNVFSNYTGHGFEHSLKVMEYMFEMITDVSELSDLEISVMIYTALLHDIGMVVTEDEIIEIQADNASIANCKYSLVLEKHQDGRLALQECIRPIHGKRSGPHIDKMKSDWFIIPNTTSTSFKDEVKNICVSHNENMEWLKSNLTKDKKKGEYFINSQFIALLLRIADLLDIDETRTPMYLYQLINPKGYGDLEWQQHLVIENTNKVFLNKETGFKTIEFYGESSNPKVHRKILKYLAYLNDEVEDSVKQSELLNANKYCLLIKTPIKNKIQTKDFNFSDFKLNLDYNAVTSLLMGEHIYGDKKYGLRELIQNSIDACGLMREISTKKIEYTIDQYKPFINIIIDRDKKQVCISDNGTGMSLDILQKYFLNVGVSYYSSDEYRFQGYKHTPIGNYGIGFLACFMLSDTVKVNTKPHDEIKIYEIELEKDSEYICLTYKEDTRRQGTEIILNYEQFFTVFKQDKVTIQKFIEGNFINCNIPIQVIEIINGDFETIICDLIKMKENSESIARLDSYLENIEGHIEINCKNINFLDNLEDFNGKTSYIYSNISNKLIDESELKPLDIRQFIQNNKLACLELPIINKYQADKFSSAFEILEDFDNALNKINDVESINIFCEDTDEFNSQRLIDRFNDDRIIGEFNFRQFCEKFDHHPSVETYTYLVENNVITKENIAEILPYDLKVSIGKEYFWDNEYVKFFIKNVFIPQFKITIPYVITGIYLKSGLFNIFNKNIIPNVSRNNVNKVVSEEFAYAIGKALHLWILDHVNLSIEEKILVQEFIKLCYPQNNSYLKDSPIA